jgi:homoserine O-acetyltransferase
VDGIAAPLSAHVRFADLFSAQSPLLLESGGHLPHVRVSYERYGPEDRTGERTVFICHALTGDSHVARHDRDDTPGWWDVMVGPGRPVDTDVLQVVCANVLGGCAGTTGPGSSNPQGRPYGPDFPSVTIADTVAVHRELLAHLGIPRLRAVVGGSYGGMQALEWLLRHPQDAGAFTLIATTDRMTTDNLAVNAVGRAAIRSDHRFAAGRYAEDPDNPGPADGLGVARMLAHLTYMSAPSLEAKFGRRVEPAAGGSEPSWGRFAIERYLEHQAAKLNARFDANSYLCLSSAMDRYDAFARPHRLSAEDLPSVQLFSFASDRLFGEDATRRLRERLETVGIRPREYRDTSSPAGHDAFLLDAPGYLREVADLLSPPVELPV